MTWYVKVTAKSPSGRVLKVLYALYNAESVIATSLRQFKEDFGDMPICTITKMRTITRGV